MTSLNLGQYSKLFAAVAGLAVTLLTQKYAASPDAANWLPYVVAAASALGVYGVPNKPATTPLSQPVVGTLQVAHTGLSDTDFARIVAEVTAAVKASRQMEIPATVTTVPPVPTQNPPV